MYICRYLVRVPTKAEIQIYYLDYATTWSKQHLHVCHCTNLALSAGVQNFMLSSPGPFLVSMLYSISSPDPFPNIPLFSMKHGNGPGDKDKSIILDTYKVLHVARYLDGFSVKKSVVSLNKEYLSIGCGQHKLQDTVSIQIILIKK